MYEGFKKALDDFTIFCFFLIKTFTIYIWNNNGPVVWYGPES